MSDAAHAPNPMIERLPVLPLASKMWTRFLIVATLITVWFLLDRLTGLLTNMWLLESLGYSDVFWTNFSMQTTLFLSCFVLTLFAIGLPSIFQG